MKHKYFPIIFAVLFLVSAFGIGAQDFGINLDNETSLNFQPDTAFGQQDRVSLWFDTGTQNKVVFSAMGSFFFDSLFTATPPPDYSIILDVDKFQLEGNFSVADAKVPTEFSFLLGRFKEKDFSGFILGHKLDGIRLGFSYPFADVSAAFGYTGLLVKPTSSIILSVLDYTEQLDSSIVFASPKLVGHVAVTFPNLFLKQTLNLAFLFQNDLDRINAALNTYLLPGETQFDPTQGGLVNTQYMGAGFSGPLVSTLFYDLYFYMNTGHVLFYNTTDFVYEYAPVVAFVTGGGFRYYAEKLLYSKFLLNFLFSSGDADSPLYVEGNTAGNSNTFMPISSSSIANIFSPRLGNLMYGTLQYSLKPFSMLKGPAAKEFVTGVDLYMFFRPYAGAGAGAIGAVGVLPGSTEKYLGTELDLNASFRPFSDLSAELSGGFFIPSAAFEDPTARGLLKLAFSMSF